MYIHSTPSKVLLRYYQQIKLLSFGVIAFMFCYLLTFQLREALIGPRLTKLRTSLPLRVYRSADNDVLVCIIPNVYQCVDPEQYIDQSVFVPVAYRAFHADLKQCLGSREIYFYNGSAPSFMSNVPRYEVDVLGQSYSSKWYRHFPHVAIGFPEQVIVPASFFLPKIDTKLPTPQCLYPGDASATPCVRNQHRLRPRILIGKHVLKSGWVLQMLQMFTTQSMDGKQPSRFLHITDTKSKCEGFRSLIVSPENYEAVRHDRSFRAAGISRKPICTGRVLIVTRDAKKKLDRTIPSETLQTFVRELRKKKNIIVEVVVGMGSLPFAKQVRVMQRADILLAVHGAEMSNLLFMRKGAQVIEIHPFGYWASYMFQPIRKSLHLGYTPLIAAPDRTHFIKCLERRRPWNKSILGGIETFDRRSKMRRNAKDEVTRWKAGEFWMEPLPARFCCRAQVIDFDGLEMARLVLRKLRNRCAATGLHR